MSPAPSAWDRHCLELAPGIYALGILHGRLEFAQALREVLAEEKPGALALELPSTLADPIRAALPFLPALMVVRFFADDGRPGFLFLTPQDALTEGLRGAQELGIPFHLVDADVDGSLPHLDAMPDPVAVSQLGARTYLEALAPSLAPDPEDPRREAHMAYQLRRLRREHDLVLFVGGIHHIAGLRARLLEPEAPQPLSRVRPRPGEAFQLSQKTQESLLCLGEAPYQIMAYEVARRHDAPAHRPKAFAQLWKSARERYQAETGEALNPQAEATFLRFAKKLCRLHGDLFPRLFDWLDAARGTVDENFAYTLSELAFRYGFRDRSGKLRELDLDEEDLLWASSRSLRIRPKIKTLRPRPSRLALRREKSKKKGQDHPADPERETTCSYPPEDLVIEAAGRRIKAQAKARLESQHHRVAPFTTSILDGVDLRETLRNWHEGRLYVRENPITSATVGSLVVIYDEDPEKYPWRVTWWGEHDQESDMAFFASHPSDQSVGPGISRCEYGGFLLSYPPRRLYDVWEDPYYLHHRDPSEVLLHAALEYSQEPQVAYVAAKPPRSHFRSLAERFGKRILYLPLGSLAHGELAKVRVFHVLESQRTRKIAADYIW